MIGTAEVVIEKVTQIDEYTLKPARCVFRVYRTTARYGKVCDNCKQHPFEHDWIIKNEVKNGKKNKSQ